MKMRIALRRRGELGVALLLALFALVVVTSIGLGMMFLTDTETIVNSNFRDEQTDYYAARAGLEEARDRMRTGATNTISASLPTALPGAAGGVLYILNPTGSETVAPWNASNSYYDDEICKEVNCSGGQVPPTSGWYVSPALTASTAYGASPVLPYKWMRVTLKTDQAAAGTTNVMYVDGQSANAAYYACWNSSANHEYVQSTACPPSRQVYMVATQAVTPSGTRRILQYEVTRDLLNLTLPAALTLDGSSVSLSTLSGPNSNPYQMQGNDHAGCGGAAGGGSSPAIGVTNNSDISTVTSGIPSNRLDHYTGSGSSPDVENISSSLSSSLNSVSALNSLLSTIMSNVTQPVLTGTVTSLSSPGTSASPQIIYVNGDLSLNGNVTGYGILVVTGTFSPGGNVGWKGIVLVVGKGNLVGNGGGNNEYDGAVLVAKTVDALGNPLATLGAANFDFSGGGGNGIFYSSGCIAQASTLSDYRILSSRELMY
jgi:hypothetical protein